VQTAGVCVQCLDHAARAHTFMVALLQDRLADVVQGFGVVIKS
jgi:hypothetical protein